MSTPENFDTTEMPKFDKLRPFLGGVAPGVMKWIEKLEAWCVAAVKEQARQDKRIVDLTDQVHDYEHEAQQQRDAEDMIERIEQRIADTVRGIYTLDETADWLRRENR